MFSVVIKAQTATTVTDKVKNRLEQLDDFEEVNNTSADDHIFLKFVDLIFLNEYMYNVILKLVYRSNQ